MRLLSNRSVAPFSIGVLSSEPACLKLLMSMFENEGEVNIGIASFR